MKRYALAFSQNLRLEFSVPDLSFKNNSKSTVSLKLLGILSQLLFIVFIGLMPLATFFFTSNIINSHNESLFYYILVFLPILLSAFFSIIVLAGRNKLIDPLNFIPVLVFSLLTTFATILVISPDGSANTGIVNSFGLRELDFNIMSGIIVIATLSIFYLFNFFSYNSKLARRVLKLFFASYIVYHLAFIVGNFLKPQVLEENFVYVFITCLLLLFAFLKFNKGKFFVLTCAVALFVVYFFSLQRDFDFGVRMIKIIFAGFLVSFAILIVYLKYNKKFFRNKIINLKESWEAFRNNKITLSQVFINLFELIFFFIPLLLLIFIAVIFITQKLNLNFIGEYAAEITESFQINVGSQDLFTNIKSILSGGGHSLFSPNAGMLANIIRIEGLLGLFAYIIILLAGVITSFKLLKRKILNGDNFCTAIVLFALINFIPLYSLFYVPTTLLVMIWWVCFVVSGILLERNFRAAMFEDNVKVSPIHFLFIKNRSGLYTKLIIVVVLFILGIVVSTNLSSVMF